LSARALISLTAGAKDSEYSLLARVVTRVLRLCKCGTVGRTHGLVFGPAAPFGGIKESGFGRDGGHHGGQDPRSGATAFAFDRHGREGIEAVDPPLPM
jgi:acyl-CoA reductase-like NAD-dependent aldehyde dehydrogenase